MNLHHFIGTGTLVRLVVRRDRFVLAIWGLLPLLIVWGQIAFIAQLPDWRQFLAELTANPLTSAWLGPVVPLDTTGAIIWRSAIQGAMIVMIGSLLTVIRHTRSEEEANRLELVRGGAIGRNAPLTAVLLVTCGVNLVSALLITLVLAGSGLPTTGSLLLGLTIAAAGWTFSGVGALAAQGLGQAGRARSIGLLCVSFALVPMVINNVAGGYTGWAWLAPMIWYRLTRPFAGDRFGPLLVMLVFAVVLMAVAYGLATRRDLHAGWGQALSGPAEAAPNFDSPLALAWRLQKTTLFSWSLGLACIGGAIGLIVPTIAEDMGTMLAGMWPEQWVTMVESVGSREAFMAVSVYTVGLLLGGTSYVISATLQLWKEEAAGRGALLLATPISRTQWMSSYLVMAFAGAACLLVVIGMAAGLGWAVASGDSRGLYRTLSMAVSKIPAVWVMGGIAALCYGMLPRLSVYLSWGIFALLVIVEILWEAQVVDWAVMQWTPFAYAHYTIPITELPRLPQFGLVGCAVLLSTLGILAFRHRTVEAQS